MPKLIVVKGVDEGRRFDVAGPTIAVGRHSANAVHLHDTQVSRRHLELRAAADGRYQLVDLGSGNGTLVNGQRVHTHALAAGDRIALGETVLLFADEDAAAADQTDRVRITAAPATELASAIVRTVREDAGSQILAHPERVGTDWLRTRLANLAVLYEAANAVSHILDVDELLGRVADLVLRAADADHACFVLTDPETGHPVPRAVRSRPGLAAAAEFAVSRTIIEHVLKERQGVLVADAAEDDRFRGGESIFRHNIREVICVPMRGRHETVGVLFLDTLASVRPTAAPAAVKFAEDHLHLAVAVAHQAALAVEETRYYQALVNAERLAAVGQTIAALSHHIKNIMQGVRFGGDMVRTGLDAGDTELLVKGWKLVEKNQARIDELVLDMLSYSKDREPAAEPTDLPALVADVLEVVRGRAADANVELAFRPPAGLPPVPCDPDGIHRALLNVVGNALDAVDGRENPRVEVDVHLADGGAWAEVVVSDNGPGIPAEKLDDIFKPFVSTKGARGTGLGLPVSRKVLREHGGNLTAASAAGQGSRFVFRLPMRAGG
jgi:signal transduction histidine kinase